MYDFEQDSMEACLENVTLKPNSKIDYYVGMVHETFDSEGNKVLAMVEEIKAIKIEKGAISLDASVKVLQVIKWAE